MKDTPFLGLPPITDLEEGATLQTSRAYESDPVTAIESWKSEIEESVMALKVREETRLARFKERPAAYIKYIGEYVAGLEILLGKKYLEIKKRTDDSAIVTKLEGLHMVAEEVLWEAHNELSDITFLAKIGASRADAQLLDQANHVPMFEGLIDGKGGDRVHENIASIDFTDTDLLPDEALEDIQLVLKKAQSLQNSPEMKRIIHDIVTTLNQSSDEDIEKWFEEVKGILTDLQQGVNGGGLADIEKHNPLAKALLYIVAGMEAQTKGRPLTKVLKDIRDNKGMGGKMVSVLFSGGLSYLSFMVTRSGAKLHIEKFGEGSFIQSQFDTLKEWGLTDTLNDTIVPGLNTYVIDMLNKYITGPIDTVLPEGWQMGDLGKLEGMTQLSIANIEGAAASGLIAAVIFMYRGIPKERRSSKQQAVYMAALLASAGLGYDSMMRSMADSAAIVRVGEGMERTLGSLKIKIDPVKIRLAKLQDTKNPQTKVVTPGVMTKVVDGALKDEIEGVGGRKPGYYLGTVTTADVLDSSASEERFRTYLKDKGHSQEKIDTVYMPKFIARRALVEATRKEDAHAKQYKDIKAWVIDLTKRLSLEDAVNKYDSAIKIKDEQSKSTPVSHFLSQFSLAGPTTPGGMEIKEKAAVTAFIGVVTAYEEAQAELAHMDVYLQKIKKETKVDLRYVVRRIKAEFAPLDVTATQLRASLLKTGEDGQVVGSALSTPQLELSEKDRGILMKLLGFLVPSDQALTDMRSSFAKMKPSKETLAMVPEDVRDAVSDGAHIAWESLPQGTQDWMAKYGWFYGIAGFFLFLFSRFDTLPGKVQRAAKMRGERLMGESVHGEFAKIEEIEAKLAERMARVMQTRVRIFEQVLVGADDGAGAGMVPDEVVALEMRVRLREELAENLPGASNGEVLKKFRNRTLYVEDHASLYREYKERLTQFEVRLDENELAVAEGFAQGIYPSAGEAVAALDALSRHGAESPEYRKAFKELQSVYERFRQEQAWSQLDTLERVLARHEVKLDALSDGMDIAEMSGEAAIITFDPNKQHVNISPDTAFEAVALAQGKGDRRFLQEMVGTVQALSDRVADSDSKKKQKPKYDELPDFSLEGALRDQVRRNAVSEIITEADKKHDQLTTGAYAQDIERFNTYMGEINRNLAAVVGEYGVLARHKTLKDYEPEVGWYLHPKYGFHTLGIILRTKDAAQAIVASVYYDNPIPDFTISSNKIRENIIEWAGAIDGDTMRGLAAQIMYRNTRMEHTQLLENVIELRSEGVDVTLSDSKPEISLLKQGNILSINDTVYLIMIDRIIEVHKALTTRKLQAQYQKAARMGGKIPNFDAFTAPEQVLSVQNELKVRRIFENIAHELQALPKSVDVKYNVADEQFEFYYIPTQEEKGKREEMKVQIIALQKYTPERCRRLVQEIVTVTTVEE